MPVIQIPLKTISHHALAAMIRTMWRDVLPTHIGVFIPLVSLFIYKLKWNGEKR